MSLLALHVANTLLHVVYTQNVPILKDSETWNDDYAINTNGIDGWSYAADFPSTQTVGLDRTYHGWFYDLYEWQYFGYFYRQFQCAYKSNIQVSYDAYFGCGYDDLNDGSVLYINENSFESAVNANNLINFTEPIAVTLSEQCLLDPGRLIGFKVNTQTIEIDAYVTFDIAFRMLVRGSAVNIAFGAISDIQITCNKVNINDPSPDPVPNTPAPTIRLIQDPLQNIGCSSMDQSTCNNNQQLCSWNSQCKCTGGATVDIILGIYAELSIDQQETGAIQKWYTDDVFTNINTQTSRVGIISFEDTVALHLNLDYHSDSDIINAFNNIDWNIGWLNYPELFNQVISEFDSIAIKNSQQILIIVADDDPLSPPSGKPISLCQYKNALQSRGIRVIVIVINHISNDPKLSNYDCIVQNDFDLIMAPSTLTYSNMNTVTNQLAAALCPAMDTALHPSLQPSLQPSENPSMRPSLHPLSQPSISPIATLNPSISPTVNPSTTRPTSQIEITFEFNTTNITTEMTEIILKVVTISGELETDQINLTISKNKVTIKAKGDEHQINDIEESVNNGDVEQEIEDKTGEKPTITISDRNNGTIEKKEDSEIRLLLIGLIVSVSLLICVIIIVSSICLYCLFVKKQKTKDSTPSTPRTESLKKHQYNNVNTHHKMISIQSMTGYSMNMNDVIQPNENIIKLEKVENNDNNRHRHVRQITGEYDIELGPVTHDMDEEMYLKPNHIHTHVKTNSGSSFGNNGECDANKYVEYNTPKHEYNTPKQSESSDNDDDDDDFDEMYIKKSNKKTKGQ